MRKILVGTLLAFAPMLRAEEKGEPKTENDRAVYALGVIVAKNLSRYSLTPEEIPFAVAGFRDQLNGVGHNLDVDAYRPRLEQLHSSREYSKVTTAKKQGAAYLTKLAAESGAKTLPTGIVIVTRKNGSGTVPKPTDTVKVHYEGAFIDGKIFDSSIRRKEPSQFKLNAVIKCWQEGIQQMKVGGKATLGCPSDFAYGDDGFNQIPGGATLIFQVELLESSS